MFSAILKLGNKGNEVKKINSILKSLGYAMSELTENFDDNTYSAIVSFQNDSGIVITGTVDKETWIALEKVNPQKEIKIRTPSYNTETESHDSKSTNQKTEESSIDVKNKIENIENTISKVNAISRESTNTRFTEFNSDDNIKYKAFTYKKKSDNDNCSSSLEIQESINDMPSYKKIKHLGYFPGNITENFTDQTISHISNVDSNKMDFINENENQDMHNVKDSSFNSISQNSQVILKHGDSGRYVRYLQNELTNFMFYKKKITKIFDNDTLIAVKSFQDVYSLIPDGIVGPKTWKMLYSLYLPIPYYS